MTQQLIHPRDRLLRVGGAAGGVGPALFAVVFILQNVVRTDDDALADLCPRCWTAPAPHQAIVTDGYSYRMRQARAKGGT